MDNQTKILMKDDRQTLKKILTYNLKVKQDLEEECQILLQLIMRKKLKNISECKILETTRKRRSESVTTATTDQNKKHSNNITNSTSVTIPSKDSIFIKDQNLDDTNIENTEVIVVNTEVEHGDSNENNNDNNKSNNNDNNSNNNVDNIQEDNSN